MTELSRAAVLDAVRYFDTWLAFRRRFARIPGIQAAVLHDDEVLLSSAYGEADVEAPTPLSARHLFRVASHSKTFTATAVLQLAEGGSLRLDDLAGQWLPFLAPSPVGQATIQELLSHGAGVIRDGHDGDHWQLFRTFPAATGFFSTAEDLVRYAAAHFHGDERLLTDASKRRMQRTQWTTGRDSEYGLGLDVTTIGDRRVLGHGGGYPGHITNTKFDPADRLAVSVLTNAIDGGAGAYAMNLFRLVELAIDPQNRFRSAPVETGTDLNRFCGRFANLWGVRDVVRLGDRLYMADPTVDDPTDEPILLAVVDEHTLRMSSENGFASPGEPVHCTFGDTGVESIRGGSGGLGFPYEPFAAAAATRERVTVGRPLVP